MSPAIDDEEVRQAAMHNAAERARIRRQQEEQEREKEKERARKKAEELAAKMEAQRAEASASEVSEEHLFPSAYQPVVSDTSNTYPGDHQTYTGKDTFCRWYTQG